MSGQHYYQATQPSNYPYGGTAQAMTGQGAYQQSYVMLQNVPTGQPGPQQGYTTIPPSYPVGSYGQGSQRGIGDQTMPGMTYGQGVLMGPPYPSAAGPGPRAGYQQVCILVTQFTWMMNLCGKKLEAKLRIASIIPGYSIGYQSTLSSLMLAIVMSCCFLMF